MTIRKAQNSTDLIFEDLYKQMVRRMLNLSFRVLNDTVAAEDVVQEAFVEGFKRLNEFEQDKNFEMWMKRVVVNRSIDVLRRRNRILFAPESALNNVSSDEGDVNEEEIELSVENVKKAVQQLPDGFRAVVSLYLFEDFSHREIAETLGITEGSSRSQYMRGRRKLLQIIQHQTQTA